MYVSLLSAVSDGSFRLCGPHDLIAGAMTLAEMTVLAMDEILLRTEISRMREEGTRRRASERARRAKDPRRAVSPGHIAAHVFPHPATRRRATTR